MHIRLDPVGGVAGDMFVAALLDAFPELEPGVLAAVAELALGASSQCRLAAHRDHLQAGKRFIVAGEHGASRGNGHDPHAHAHPHRTWASIREVIERSRLDEPTRRHAVGIFALLAAAEAQVHGIAEDDVGFHEVGAIDSICDIVAAAHMIAKLDATWSVGALPLGSGTVMSAHGRLPVPAPATALLLRGLPMRDDGIGGERVTPTGAAIVKYLAALRSADERPRVLDRIGLGFGTRVIPGLSNCLRVLTFSDDEAHAAAGAHRELAVLRFEVDDQAPEDLALGLDRLRGSPGIHEVIQIPVFGKKGRLLTQVQVLAAPETLDDVIRICFEETTTIGLRYEVVRAIALKRTVEQVQVGDRPVRVKSVQRPRGRRTAKAEIDDAANEAGSAARARLRREAEDLVLGRDGETDARDTTERTK
jgi:uncharacterized protein (TIGR00299 family) protein